MSFFILCEVGPEILFFIGYCFRKVVIFDAPEAFGLLGELMHEVVRVVVFHVASIAYSHTHVINKKAL